MQRATVDAVIAPVSLNELQGVLNRDFARVRQSGVLAPTNGIGIVIGVVQHRARQILTYGSVKPDSMSEIGSITKTFTGLILAQMVEQGKVTLDEPVRDLLPRGIVAKPIGREITLLDLATQRSGLPRMPNNFHPADPQNPYGDYSARDLYAYVALHGVAKRADAGFLYSNLGFALLGQAVANCAATSYPELLRTEVTGPLGLQDTTVVLSADQQKRFLQGHAAGPGYRPVHSWDLDAFAGAGAIRSTANDMLTYLEAHLRPQRATQMGKNTGNAATLTSAIEMSHQLRADAVGGLRIALAWLYNPQEGTYWHNGATAGYSAFALFNPRLDYGIIVLANVGPSPADTLADRTALHVNARLTGQKAVSIE